MWGRVNKHSSDIDLSTVTAAPSGITGVGGGFAIAVGEVSGSAARRKVYDELWMIFTFDAGTDPTVDVVPWFYVPDFSGGTWIAGAKMAGIPDKDDTTADLGQAYRIQAPPMSTRMYVQRTAVSGAPTTVEVSVYGAEEVH